MVRRLHSQGLTQCGDQTIESVVQSAPIVLFYGAVADSHSFESRLVAGLWVAAGCWCTACKLLRFFGSARLRLVELSSLRG